MKLNEITSKNIGTALIINSILLILLQLIFVGVGSYFILSNITNNGINLIILIPFIFYSLTILALPVMAIYPGIRYLKNKPFNINQKIGNTIIILAVIFVLFELLGSISNLAFLKLLSSILWGSYLAILGFGIKNIKPNLDAK
jgi:hypothetical protein